jgi:hypothetical protein
MSEHSGMTSNLPAADVRNWTLTLSSQKHLIYLLQT